MHTIFTQLLNDEAGFIISAELILVSTITVLALVVGLSEVAHAVNEELEDVGSAFGSVNQTFQAWGQGGHFAQASGSAFLDHADFCDSEFDMTSTAPQQENQSQQGW